MEYSENLPDKTIKTISEISPVFHDAVSNRVEHVNNLEGSDHQAPDQQKVVDLGDMTDLVPKPVLFVLSFNNLVYTVESNRQSSRVVAPNVVDMVETAETSRFSSTKILLNDISGAARDGEILAVLGASGSGKSTLIDALAGRIDKRSLKGSVMLNDEALNTRLLKLLSAYVMQDDLLFPMLTVEETLMFSAELRLPCLLSKSKKKARVEALIDQLGLQNAAKTIIGDESHRGVSGGERRRVSIGINIIHDPVILFLDEPTSGLDSSSALTVVKTLQRIAQSGSIVIMSIHQPTYRILGLLDRLTFLSRGQIVYSGTPTDLSRFFSDLGHSISENENSTEFALDLINEYQGSEGGTKCFTELYKSWQKMQYPGSSDSGKCSLSLRDAIRTSISRGKLASSSPYNHSSPTSMISTATNPFWVEFMVLTKRSMKNSSRMPEVFIARLVPMIVTCLVIASIYWQLDISLKGAQERLGCFGFLIVIAYFSCGDALPLLFQERCILCRETAYNAYHYSSYVLSKTVTEMPSLVILSLAITITTFWAVGLAGGFHGYLFLFVTVLASFWAGSSLMAFISAVVPHIMMGYIIVLLSLGFFFLFSGVFINRDRIPWYWIWLHYLSLLKYPFEGVMQNEFDDPLKCFVRGVQMFDRTPLAGIQSDMKLKFLKMLSDASGMNVNSNTCITTGVDILRESGFTALNKWSCLWITVAWGFFFRILFYISLVFGNKNKRR
ncbi:hypothetical protein MKW98_005224 [Papaver atlanticum]|uniref:ABC transporter domain-containing protein n=1 Tax=Papaver atlanticum TaxID=357466 RepID=A0AAD4RWC9_9MAGN|nr:hypothetical protein MKW98_005224 [Papaver atlanticum]